MVAINEISTSIGEREALRGRGELCVETPVFTAPDSTGNRWGDAAVQSTFGGNSIIYCGYSYNPETENYYVRNRYYSPSLGRWITRDPIGISGGINLYGYVESEPVGSLDPSGKDAWGFGIPDGSNLYAYGVMQQFQNEQRKARQAAMRQAWCKVSQCASDAAKLSLTLAVLALEISEAWESLGVSAIVTAPFIADDLADANAELGELSRDGCFPAYKDLVYRAKTLIKWASDLVAP